MYIFAGLLVLLMVLDYGAAAAQTESVPDMENCLFCHRYPQMGRFDKTGKKRILYVNDEQFANSVHGKLRCTSCHVGLDEIPHTDVKKVDCSTKCHIEEPSTNKEFSHINMVKKYQMSVHGLGNNKNPKPYPEDLPTCKYCHNNRMYNPLVGMWDKSEELSNETLARCQGCHTDQQWAHRFYSHFTHRMRRRRSQIEIIKLCTSCHEDQEKMARHGLESVETYKDTFHWVQVSYGVKSAPGCISCHVPVGYSTHTIRPKTDPVSPINMDNRVMTCSNQGGLQTCHPSATAEFAKGRVHAYGMKAQIMAGKNAVGVEEKDKLLIIERAKTDMPDEEVFHYKILKIIRLFYQVLIAVVIGSMCFHQLIDYIHTRKNH
jgi:hypothetical protein